MPTAFVLYIKDDIVGPCLELIRKVFDPLSTSKPHITVRYVSKLLNNDLGLYNTTKIPYIDIIGPGSFGINEDKHQVNKTVFIKCASDLLEDLSHKPHFPDSVFHITLYDGNSDSLANMLLQILNEYDWKFRLEFNNEVLLNKIEIKSKKKKHIAVNDINYNNSIKAIFEDITSNTLTFEYLMSLTDDERLILVRKICSYLHFETRYFHKVSINSKFFADADPHAIWLESSKQKNQIHQSDLSGKWTGDIQRAESNKTGLYLTPPELAREITEYTLNLFEKNSKINFGDPAIGTGVFFSALCQVVEQDRIESAIGIEIDFNRAVATQERWSHKGLNVLRGDYLHMDQLPPRNLILANPPYVRYQHLEPEYGQKLRQKASLTIEMQINGQSGLYVYFLLLSHTWMEHAAIASWLVPSEFMETKYGAAIRYYLTHRVKLIRIHKYNAEDAQFENALVSSAVVVFKNIKPKVDDITTISTGGSLSKPSSIEQVSIGDLQKNNKWTVLNDTNCKSLGPKFGDLFTVSRGIATGANNFFILQRSEALRIGIPESALRPILPKARSLHSDIVERDHDGYPSINPQYCVLDCTEPEEAIRIKYPQLMDYLKSADDTILTSALVRRRKPWYRQERRLPAPYLCTYMGRGGKNNPPIRIIWNKSDAIATNVYLMLYPKLNIEQLLENHPQYKEELFKLLSDSIKDGINLYTRQYGGGLLKIEPKELLNVKLKYCPEWLIDALDKTLF